MTSRLIIAAFLLAACTQKTVVRYLPPSCPAVPECTRAPVSIFTNGDLAAAYLQRDAELRQCKIARDTLHQCIDNTAGGVEK